jgi:hypothetical protein
MRLSFLYVALLLWLVACYVPPVDETDQPAGPFFDLEGFFEKEAAFLSSQQLRVQKTIQQNGQRESQEVVVDDWKRELSFFAESDINKPSWRDQYTVDSTRSANKLTIEYRSKDKNLSTQKLDIEIVADTVQSVLVLKNIDNQVYSSQQSLTYIAKQGYKINQAQDIVLLSGDHYNIEANYLYE